MTNGEINILKYHVKDILNKYPNALQIVVDKNELRVSPDFKYHDAWTKFVNGYYEWDIFCAKLDEKFNLRYLKRLLQAKQFLKLNYKKGK